jgi:mycothiol system anti-sigma-R factor
MGGLRLRRKMMSDEMRPTISTCPEAQGRLYEYLDGELSAAEAAAVRRDLWRCEECARRFRFEEDLLATIRQVCRASRAPEALRQRLEGLIAHL